MIDGKTNLVGLIGWPVSHSFSPVMHNAALAALGINWAYVPLLVAERRVGEAVRGLRALGFRGANVTVPHKQAVMPYLDEISPAAAAIGAVNTILVEGNEEGRLIGTNSDWRGFVADLAAQSIAVEGRQCLVLGAGGSARAVCYGLRQAGGDVTVVARRIRQAQALTAAIGLDDHDAVRELADLASVAGQSDAPLIVNTTPVGMSPHWRQSIWPDEVPFPPGSFAYDLVYNPTETRFMRQAAASGCAASNGLGMLLHQGAVALTLWTGLEPDLDVMRAALEDAGG